MATKTKPWRPDFAGRHGTAWGAVNLCLTTVSIATVEHVFFGAPWWWASVLVGAGILCTLFVVVFRKPETSPATVAYQIACWAGAGIWSAWMLAKSEWTFRGWVIGVAILAGATFFAGILVWLGSEKESGAAKPVEMDMEATSQRARNALGAKYVEVIHRMASHSDADNPLVVIEGIEEWPHGGGHTVEGRFTSGKFGLAELDRLGPRIALDLGLDEGCGVEVKELPGGSRKVWLMDVTTSNALAKGAPYPADTAGPYSINGMIPVGVRPNGVPIGPTLRQRNMAIQGMPGSGKTGGLQATVASLAVTADCQQWGWDATGADLIQPFQKAFLEGRAKLPVFAHIADTYDEGAAQLRAALRISYARKMAYGYIKTKYDQALLPMGVVVSVTELAPGARAHFPADAPDRLIPQIEWVGDETTGLLCSRNPEHPEMSMLVAKVMQETRGSGIRVLVPPLGGDDQYIGQKYQKLIHTVVALKMDSAMEYKHALGMGYTVDPKDVSVAGTGMWRDEPSSSLEKFRFYGEMKQSVVDKVAIRADQLGTLPDLDFISELAANGIRPDGTPWPVDGVVMKEGDRGWWDRRWEKLTAGRTAEPAPMTPPARPAPSPRGSTAIMDADQIQARVREVEKLSRQHNVSGDLEAEKILEGADWSELASWLPAISAPTTWRDAVMKAIRDAGAKGIATGELVKIADVHRSEVSKFLRDRLEEGHVCKPHGDGIWVIPPDERL